MAEIRSEDTDCPSKIIIEPIGEKQLPGRLNEPGQRWQMISIRLHSGQRSISTMAQEEVMLCRAPLDEVAELIAQLQQLLAGKRQQVLFEPSEPSFELSLARTARGGIQVEIWLDAGNGTTGIYTWDACGIRLVTTDALMDEFISSCKSTFSI